MLYIAIASTKHEIFHVHSHIIISYAIQIYLLRSFFLFTFLLYVHIFVFSIFGKMQVLLFIGQKMTIILPIHLCIYVISVESLYAKCSEKTSPFFKSNIQNKISSYFGIKFKLHTGVSFDCGICSSH